MPRILRRLPYIHHAARPPLLSGRARRHQIVFHLGIAPLAAGESEAIPPNLQPVPVVLDTGFTHGLLLRRSHLASLCLTPTIQYRPTDFTTTGNTVKLIRRRPNPSATPDAELVEVPTRDARVWMYPNEPGTWKVTAGATPIFLPLPNGVIIAPSDDLTPSEMACPLFGLGGMDDCELFAIASSTHFDLWAGQPFWWRLLRGLLR